MSRDLAPFGLRMLPSLKERIAREAFVAGRSMNSEIVTRLESTFAAAPTNLPPAVQAAVEDDIDAHGGTPAEALTRLVVAGQSNGGTVLNITLSGDMPLARLVEMLKAAQAAIPPDASVVVRRG